MPGLILLIISGLLSFLPAPALLLWELGWYIRSRKSINVQLHNGDNSPSLVQAWLDTGDASGSPGAVKVPFVITPPVSRIEPKTGQTLRIMYTGESLPGTENRYFI